MTVKIINRHKNEKKFYNEKCKKKVFSHQPAIYEQLVRDTKNSSLLRNVVLVNWENELVSE